MPWTGFEIPKVQQIHAAIDRLESHNNKLTHAHGLWQVFRQRDEYWARTRTWSQVVNEQRHVAAGVDQVNGHTHPAHWAIREILEIRKLADELEAAPVLAALELMLQERAYHLVNLTSPEMDRWGGDGEAAYTVKASYAPLPHPMIATLRREAEPAKEEIISIGVVLQRYATSRATIKRYVKEGKLTDYRPANAPKNAGHRLSVRELDRSFHRLFTE